MCAHMARVPPRIHVVIVCRARKKSLDRCIENVGEATRPNVLGPVTTRLLCGDRRNRRLIRVIDQCRWPRLARGCTDNYADAIQITEMIGERKGSRCAATSAIEPPVAHRVGWRLEILRRVEKERKRETNGARSVVIVAPIARPPTRGSRSRGRIVFIGGRFVETLRRIFCTTCAHALTIGYLCPSNDV